MPDIEFTPDPPDRIALPPCDDDEDEPCDTHDGGHPVNPELFRRTAPAWNCVDYPGEGPHYLNRSGSCQWCGMTRDQINAERNPQ